MIIKQGIEAVGSLVELYLDTSAKLNREFKWFQIEQEPSRVLGFIRAAIDARIEQQKQTQCALDKICVENGWREGTL